MATRPRTQKSSTQSAKPKKERRHYGGPTEWLFPRMEEVYSKLIPKAQAEQEAMVVARSPQAMSSVTGFRSTFHEGRDESVLSTPPSSFWQQRLEQYHQRRLGVGAARPRGLAPAMPAIGGQNNWTPLGPSIVVRGQTANRAPISGRVPGIAVAPGGNRLYVASANGGVWRSDDAGASWRSLMDGFDQNPTNVASSSLCCGAIAIDPNNPDRIYVGTGEGDTDQIFANRIVNAPPAYRGIGPIRSDDGGTNWVQETSSPSLADFAFFQIAVDPGDPEHCVAATSNGLYERINVSSGVFTWQRRRTPRHSSVVVARIGTVTTWFAAEYGGVVHSSTTGNTWMALGTGFPTSIGRIALGVQRDNPNVVYAMVANTLGALNSVRRLDGIAGAWKNIAGIPNVLPVDSNGNSQGDYDLCIAVDPNNANRIYLGGSYFNVSPYPGSIWRCDIAPAGVSYSATSASIGNQAHADVHCLVHTPGDSNTLWTGNDGGVFVNLAPTAAGQFEHRNTGLATLCTSFLAQHPTEPAVMYVGLQDNGTAKYTGDDAWRNIGSGDGGYCVVNWADPFRVLHFANGGVNRATDGGMDWPSWSSVTPSGAKWVLMASPLVGPPFNAAVPAQAETVAYGAGTAAATIIYFSSDFGSTWPVGTRVTLPPGSSRVFSMVFASATRLYAGMTNGQVFRVDLIGSTWTATRIDNAIGGVLPLSGLVTDIAVDPSDAMLNSIFICFGGAGDFRHVWRFNGVAWQARSGTTGSGTELIDVEHNAITYDAVTNRVYVGADIGAWESLDGGSNWAPLSNGLPDAPVYDLQVHPTARLLRATLHGRGVWEWKLDAPLLPDVELYVRDTMLDTGRGVNTDGRNDPSIFPTGPVYHWLSPSIKVDVPTPAGYQTATTTIDFPTFVHTLQDGSGGVATNVPPPTVHNRVYVEVHNRGRFDANNVQVTVAIKNAATGLALPSGYTAAIIAGNPLPAPWVTLGTVTLAVVRAGFPQIAAFDLPSDVLPMPASLPGNSHWCSVAFVRCLQDPFTGTLSNVDALTLADRKVCQKNLHIVEFVGVPPPTIGIGTWAMLIVSGAQLKKRGLIDLTVDARGFSGDIHLILPPALIPVDAAKQVKGLKKGSAAIVKRWLDGYAPIAERLFFEAKYPQEQFALLRVAMNSVKGQTPFVLAGGGLARLSQLPLGPKDEIPIFLRIDPPANANLDSVFEFDVLQSVSGERTDAMLGGSRYRVVVNRKAR